MTTQRAGAGEHEPSGRAYCLGLKGQRPDQKFLRMVTGRTVNWSKIIKECICDIQQCPGSEIHSKHLKRALEGLIEFVVVQLGQQPLAAVLGNVVKGLSDNMRDFGDDWVIES